MKTTLKLTCAALLLTGLTSWGFAATAAENWDNDCASCHGADGKGQTKQGKKLKLRDYTDAAVQADLQDAAMLKAILEGVKDKDGGKERMKSFKDELSEDEAKDLVAFVRKLKA